MDEVDMNTFSKKIPKVTSNEKKKVSKKKNPKVDMSIFSKRIPKIISSKKKKVIDELVSCDH